MALLSVKLWLALQLALRLALQMTLRLAPVLTIRHALRHARGFRGLSSFCDDVSITVLLTWQGLVWAGCLHQNTRAKTSTVTKLAGLGYSWQGLVIVDVLARVFWCKECYGHRRAKRKP